MFSLFVCEDGIDIAVWTDAHFGRASESTWFFRMMVMKVLVRMFSHDVNIEGDVISVTWERFVDIFYQ